MTRSTGKAATAAGSTGAAAACNPMSCGWPRQGDEDDGEEIPIIAQ